VLFVRLSLEAATVNSPKYFNKDIRAPHQTRVRI
jgi:hypothetical protein